MRWLEWGKRMNNKHETILFNEIVLIRSLLACVHVQALSLSFSLPIKKLEIANIALRHKLWNNKTRREKSNREAIRKQDKNHLFKSQYGFEHFFFLSLWRNKARTKCARDHILVLSIIFEIWLTWVWYKWTMCVYIWYRPHWIFARCINEIA